MFTEEIFKQYIVDVVDNMHKQKEAPKPQPLVVVSRKQAASMLSVCIATIDNYARWGWITKYKVGKAGKTTRFKVEDVLSLLKDSKAA